MKSGLSLIRITLVEKEVLRQMIGGGWRSKFLAGDFATYLTRPRWDSGQRLRHLTLFL